MSSSVIQVEARRPAPLPKKTPPEQFFKDSAKIVNCLFNIYKEHLLGKKIYIIKNKIYKIKTFTSPLPLLPVSIKRLLFILWITKKKFL